MNKHNQNRSFVFGFMGFQDFTQTLLGLKTPILNFMGGLFTVLLKVAGFIYSSKMAVALVVGVMMVDWGTGVYKAIKLGKFNSFTFQRMLINIFFTLLVICIAYQMSLVLPLIAWMMLPEFLLGGFLVTYFFSIFENLHQADARIIPDKMYKHLRFILDLDRIVPEYFKIKTPAEIKTEPQPEPEKKEESKDEVVEENKEV